ncbi:hypothetical protein KSS87_012820 [Heliosperma pusillum]|nr:hypothetical protein KSS87_012820 [Heliosperma pusillum]
MDENMKRQKEIEDWLPITSARNAKWWYSAFHNVTAMVGAGVLGLPYAMSQLGWGPGVAILVLSWVITLYTLWQMVEMHEMVPGKRFDRYHELGQHAFGDKLGLWIVVPQQIVVEVGVDIVYMVTGGKSLKKFHDLICKQRQCKNDDIKTTYFIMIFASVHFVLSHLPNFNAIAGVSLAAAVMSLSYSTIAWTSSLHKGVQPEVSYALIGQSNAAKVLDFFNALGTVAFAYAGHNVVLEIQATIPSTPEKPSKKPMWKGVIVAYIVVAICYFPVSLLGYWVFGNVVSDDILISLEKPVWLIALANLFVVIHVIGSYQANPSVASYANKYIEHWDDISILLGPDRAVGDGGEHHEEGATMMDDEACDGSSSSIDTTSMSSKKKRKSDSLADAVTQVVDTLKSYVEARLKATPTLGGKEVFDEVSKVVGILRPQVLRAVNMFVEMPVKFQVLKDLPSDQKLDWILLCLDERSRSF